MSRIYVLVEGQTEESFVNEVLGPDFASRGLYLTAIIVRTSQSGKGGLISYGKVKPQIDKLCRQHRTAFVTTMFDLYALPNDFPGKTDREYGTLRHGADKADYLQRALEKDIAQENFIANITVHEFEALLFSDISAFEAWVDEDAVLDPLRLARQQAAPEDINDSPHTAPSKRILSCWPAYDKVWHGSLIAIDIGLHAIRTECPHFDAWLKTLEKLYIAP